MQYLLIIISVISIVFALFSAYLGERKKFVSKIIFKALASALFFLAGIIFAVKSNLGNYGLMITIFLALSMLGDVFLSLHVILPQKLKNVANLLGGLLFLGAHILLFVTFAKIAKFNPILLALLPLLPIIIAIFAKAKLVNITKKMIIPCIIYALALNLLLVACINIALAKVGTTVFNSLVISAGVTFVISDLFLLLANFGKDEKIKRQSMYVVMAFYYLAQNIFAFTIFYA